MRSLAGPRSNRSGILVREEDTDGQTDGHARTREGGEGVRRQEAPARLPPVSAVPPPDGGGVGSVASLTQPEPTNAPGRAQRPGGLE